MARRAVPGIFCVEGGWSSQLTSRQTVRPLLEYLERVGQVRYVHLQAHTFDAALDALRRWPQAQYRRYPLGYLGFHGGAGHLYMGRHKLTLSALAGELNGACVGKTLYFGSCSVLDVPRREVERFRRQIGARCVAGYTTDIDWYESAAFDLLLFEALTRYQRMDAVDRWLQGQYGGFVRRLGFRMYYGGLGSASGA